MVEVKVEFSIPTALLSPALISSVTVGLVLTDVAQIIEQDLIVMSVFVKRAEPEAI